MWELDCEEGWAPKNWCFWIVVLEKTLDSPLDWEEIQPVHSEGDQPWDFFGRNHAKAETAVLWPPHAKSWLIGKDSDAGRGWGQEEKGTTGWDGWMASPTQWTWVRVNSRSWWWTGRPGVLQFMGSQRVGHDWATELNWAHGKDSDAGKDKAGEGNDRGWDGWMTSLMRWTWVWLSSESWWWTGEPGVLQSMGSQSQIQLSNSTELNWACKFS